MTNRSFLFKIVLIGDGGVGKTTLRRRWMGEGFVTSYILTVGADFAVKTLITPYGHEVKFQIWDLGGQPHFKEVRKTFYAGTAGALVVYDVTDRKSYNNVFGWIEEMLKHVKQKIPIVLVGNKIDLRNNVPDTITTEEGINLRKEIMEKYGLDVLFIETSAKTGENVDKAFQGMAKLLLHQLGVIELKDEEKIVVVSSAPSQSEVTEATSEIGVDPRGLLNEICRILGFDETEWQSEPQKILTKIKEIISKINEAN
ncbi:MAG: Rab family GTPase [Candidatus Baldrarchaeia archaeon]